MALSTYTELKASIADTLNRADLTTVIPDFITLAEAQMNRRLIKDGPVRQQMASATITINAEFVNVPTDFLGVRAIYPGTTSSVPPLQFAEPEKIVELKVNQANQSGDISIFSIVGAQYQFWPWNSGTYTGKQIYWQSLPPLASNSSNWMLAANPDAYLYGALLQSAPYLKDDDRLAVWGTAFGQILTDIIDADKVQRFAPSLAVSPNYSIV
jgi:hypothetical protein